jgi:hypothetical protein
MSTWIKVPGKMAYQRDDNAAVEYAGEKWAALNPNHNRVIGRRWKSAKAAMSAMDRMFPFRTKPQETKG